MVTAGGARRSRSGTRRARLLLAWASITLVIALVAVLVATTGGGIDYLGLVPALPVIFATASRSELWFRRWLRIAVIVLAALVAILTVSVLGIELAVGLLPSLVLLILAARPLRSV